MAITRVGSWVSRFGGSASGTAGSWTGTTATLPLGTTPAADDCVILCLYNRVQNNGVGTNPNGSGFSWTTSSGLGTYALTRIQGSGAASNNGSIEVLYWRADGSSNPTFAATPVANGNSTAVIAAAVYHGVDWASGPIDVYGHNPTVNPTTDKPPTGTAVSTPFDWTGLAFNMVNGGRAFAFIGNAAYNASWTPNGAGTNTQSWGLEHLAGGANGVGGGAAIIAGSVDLGAGVGTGTINYRTTSTITLGRAVTFGLRAATGGSVIAPALPHITVTVDPLTVGPVVVAANPIHLNINVVTPTVTGHFVSIATADFGVLDAHADGTVVTAGTSNAAADLGTLDVFVLDPIKSTHYSSEATADFGQLIGQVDGSKGTITPPPSGGGGGSQNVGGGGIQQG